MSYHLKPVAAKLSRDRITWGCPCGVHLEVECTLTPQGVGYQLDTLVDSVTGGVSVSCSGCDRRFFLPCQSPTPTVSEVILEE